MEIPSSSSYFSIPFSPIFSDQAEKDEFCLHVSSFGHWRDNSYIHQILGATWQKGPKTAEIKETRSVSAPTQAIEPMSVDLFVKTPSSTHQGQPSIAKRGFWQANNDLKATIKRMQKDHQSELQSANKTQNEIYQKNDELNRARRHIQSLEVVLEDCRKQVFKSIPTNGIGGADISHEYSILQESFSDWVEGLPEMDDFVPQMEYIESTIRG